MATQNEVLLNCPSKEATMPKKHQATTYSRRRAIATYPRKPDHQAERQSLGKERLNTEQMSQFLSDYWFD